MISADFHSPPMDVEEGLISEYRLVIKLLKPSYFRCSYIDYASMYLVSKHTYSMLNPGVVWSQWYMLRDHAPTWQPKELKRINIT